MLNKELLKEIKFSRKGLIDQRNVYLWCCMTRDHGYQMEWTNDSKTLRPPSRYDYVCDSEEKDALRML